jgi:hypothetical protein
MLGEQGGHESISCEVLFSTGIQAQKWKSRWLIMCFVRGQDLVSWLHRVKFCAFDYVTWIGSGLLSVCGKYTYFALIYYMLGASSNDVDLLVVSHENTSEIVSSFIFGSFVQQLFLRSSSRGFKSNWGPHGSNNVKPNGRSAAADRQTTPLRTYHINSPPTSRVTGPAMWVFHGDHDQQGFSFRRLIVWFKANNWNAWFLLMQYAGACISLQIKVLPRCYINLWQYMKTHFGT